MLNLHNDDGLPQEPLLTDLFKDNDNNIWDADLVYKWIWE